MIREMILPQLGMGMSEGTIVEWTAKEGERVEREQTVLAVETEKVVADLPSPYAGFVHILVGKGTTVPIETLIGQIADTQEEYQRLVGGTPSPAANEARGPAEGVVAVAAPAGFAARRIKVSGLARKLASDHGIDLETVTGTGPAGRIVKRDLASLLAKPVSAPPLPTLTSSPIVVHPSGIREKVRIPISGIRRTIAQRMAQAKNVAPHTHVFFEIDVTKLVAVHETLRVREHEIGARISMTAIYTRALALACQHVPICNAAVIDGEIVLWDEVHVGIGVALPGRNQYDSALMVPVVRNAEAKGLMQLDAEIRTLVAKARDGKLRADDVANSTITISKGNKFDGWKVGTPLLTLPQVVAFGPGSPVRKPVVRDDGQIVAAYILPCCLTFDHRALDGEPTNRLAKKLADLLGHPELMLL